MHVLSETWRTALTSLVGVLTLLGIMTRPFRLNEAFIAMGGAAVLLLPGFVGPGEALMMLLMIGTRSFSFWE